MPKPAVEAALKLREKVRLEDIEKIRIDTYEAAYTIIGPKDPRSGIHTQKKPQITRICG
jgi:2-methylcitrate dehydratase PrpD